MTRQLRVAILGLGRSGRDIHGDYLVHAKDKYKIVAVVDPLEKRRLRAITEYGCEAFENYSALFGREDLDLIINATPSHMHVPVTCEFLNAGYHVLCDKPLARTVQEIDLLMEASKKSGKTLSIFQQSRYYPHFQQIKKIIDSGILGRIVQISSEWNSFSRRWDWQCIQACNGGSLLNTGPHPLDQVLQLLGNDVIPEVTCVLDKANTFGDAEDYVKIMLRAPGRPVIDLEISSCCAYPNSVFNIQGTNGGLKSTYDHIDWKYFIPDEAPAQKLVHAPLDTDEGTPAYCREQLKWYEESWDLHEEQALPYDPLSKSFYDMLYAALAEGAELEITAAQIRQQIAVIEECYRQNKLPRIYDCSGQSLAT